MLKLVNGFLRDRVVKGGGSDSKKGGRDSDPLKIMHQRASSMSHFFITRAPLTENRYPSRAPPRFHSAAGYSASSVAGVREP
jgi:hypothetical protein